MKYLKIFTDFAVDMEELGDAECGRLFKAMLEYAATGIAPALKGNERFLWGTAKKNIDVQRESYENRCLTNKIVATKRYETLRCDTKRNETYQDKDKDKEKKKKSTALPRFVPPTLNDVRAYVSERGSNVDPVKFFDYFSAGDWIDSKGQPVRNWKQKIITWENKMNGGEKHEHSGHAVEDSVSKWSNLDIIQFE